MSLYYNKILYEMFNNVVFNIVVKTLLYMLFLSHKKQLSYKKDKL